jgi:WD40 repeat protein
VLAVGNAAGLLLFSMNYPPTGGILSSAIPALDAMDFSCSLIKFIPGSSKRFACCTSQGDIRIIKIQQETDREKDVTCSACEEYALKENKGRGSYSHLAVSTDGQWLASASYNTASGIVHVFSISKDFKHWWTLPATEAPISCLKFLGGYTPVLFIGCNNYAFYIYDIERRTLSDFSQDLGFPMSPLLPHELNHRTECPSHVTQNPTKVNQFFMVSDKYASDNVFIE